MDNLDFVQYWQCDNDLKWELYKDNIHPEIYIAIRRDHLEIPVEIRALLEQEV